MRVKICGLSEPKTLRAAVENGAAYVGFVHFEKSPRHVSVKQLTQLAQEVPPGVCKVALMVDPSDEQLDTLLADAPIDMIQLHGHESASRTQEIRTRFGLPVMKAIGISDEADLQKITEFSAVADQLLVDAKPSPDMAVPGGNGVAFDWRLIAGRRWACPWMLAGGLTVENVADAIYLTGAKQIDVSSGVERARGVKDEKMIGDFIAAAGGKNAR